MEYVIVYFEDGKQREKIVYKEPGKSIAESCHEWLYSYADRVECPQLYVDDRGSRHFIESIY